MCIRDRPQKFNFQSYFNGFRINISKTKLFRIFFATFPYVMYDYHVIITYLKTGERDDIENCCLRAEGPKATIFNVVSFPCFEVRGNSIVS